MTSTSLTGLALVVLLAVAAPTLAAVAPRRLVPGIVVELLLGLLLGPHALGWIRIDAVVDTLSLLGVTFLFFLAGLEIDLSAIRGALLARSLGAYTVSLALALAFATAGQSLGLLESPALVGTALSATGLGLVVPILRDAQLLRTPAGRTVVAAASVAEFAAVVVLAVAFGTGPSASRTTLLLAGLALAAVAATVAGRRLGAHAVVASLLDRLSGGTTQLRVRIGVATVVGFAALAQAAGLEVVLGAFFAGGIVNVLDRGMAEPGFRDRLDGIGYGFLVPVFFIAAGARLDLSALPWPSAALLVPLLVLALLVARAAPATLLPLTGARQTWGGGLLCATSLPFIVTATQVGPDQGRLGPATAAALTAAGLIGVCLFPPVGTRLLSRPDGNRRSR